MRTLFIVPTPIGNLEDITLRALRVLKEVSLIAAEDTRTSRVLLKHYDIHTPLTSYHEHNKLDKLETIIAALDSGDVALISDAGTPGISDPGYELIQTVIAQGYNVVPLPGANAVITAFVASGFPTDSFIYMGFFPRKASAQVAFLNTLQTETRPVILYESPNRLLDTLHRIVDVLGEARAICVGRELTKIHEEFQRGSAADVLAHYQANPPRGEITLIIGGVQVANTIWDEARVRSALVARIKAGESHSSAAKAVAKESGWNKRDVYQLKIQDKENLE
ncbi:MAG: 16S rRNA (cytidine(1402)-2'-O)-methyltransferase [Phototrophicales bacterium]|nr:MAG: 16S rRNA (cytidine(1402)-2'-O)-methyltransferase [Phototrophicales bacterium]RMG74918.1 MAG: 16S rRNA (cytidine(1402)-2'-O)-methyltransferase [Chloroflexota bacterium]